MKTVTDRYRRAIRDGVRVRTHYWLVPTSGSTIDVTERVVAVSGPDERLSTIDGDVDGGDVTLTLDNRDGYLVGDGVNVTGILEDLSERWQLRVIDQPALGGTEEPSVVSFFGLVDGRWQRRESGSRIEVRAISYIGHARNVGAWDGNDGNRLIYNISVSTLLEQIVIPRLETHGTIAVDFDIRDIVGSSDYMQVFDSLIEDAAAGQALDVGPSEITWVYESGGDHFFFLFTATSTRRGYTLRMTPEGYITSAATHPYDWSSVLDGDRNDIQTGVDNGTIWIRNLDLPNVYFADTTLASPIVNSWGVSTFGSTQPKISVVNVDRAYCYVVGWSGSTVKAWLLDGYAGTATLVFDQATGVSIECATINRAGTYVGAFAIDEVRVYDVATPATNATIAFTDRGEVVNPDAFCHVENVSGSLDWGYVAWKEGDVSPGHSEVRIAGAMVDDNGASLPVSADSMRWAGGGDLGGSDFYGFGPDDGVGLLSAEDDGNDSGEDQRLDYFVHLRPGYRPDRFSALFRGDVGIGHKTTAVSTLQALSSSQGAIVTSQLPYSSSALRCGQECYGTGLDDPFFVQALHLTRVPKRILVGVRTALTAPVVQEIDLKGSTSYQVINESLRAVNAVGCFRWDDSAGNGVFMIRSRGEAFGAHSDLLPIIQATDGFAHDVVYTGVVLTVAFGIRFVSGDNVSSTSYTLSLDIPYASPSGGQQLADDILAFVGTARRPIDIEVPLAPYVELVDTVKALTKGDARVIDGLVIGRRRVNNRGTMVLETVAV